MGKGSKRRPRSVSKSKRGFAMGNMRKIKRSPCSLSTKRKVSGKWGQLKVKVINASAAEKRGIEPGVHKPLH